MQRRPLVVVATIHNGNATLANKLPQRRYVTAGGRIAQGLGHLRRATV